MVSTVAVADALWELVIEGESTATTSGPPSLPALSPGHSRGAAYSAPVPGTIARLSGEHREAVTSCCPTGGPIRVAIDSADNPRAENLVIGSEVAVRESKMPGS
jgi:hypothetical protein